MSSRKISRTLDMIDVLPDELLHKILYHLNVKQVVQTSILSKRWKTLWISHPYLNIEDRMWPQIAVLEEKIVLRTFLYHIFCRRGENEMGDQVHQFRISSSSYPDAEQINHWIRCYASHVAREIIIENMPRLLPDSLHSYYVTKSVRLSSVVLRPSLFRNLNLEYEKCLENLVIKDCKHVGIDRIRVSAPGLKNLIVENNHIYLADVRNIETCVFMLSSVSEITSIQFKGYMYGDYLFEKGIPTVLGAHLDTKVTNTRMVEDGEGLGRCLPNVLEGLSNAKSLTISMDSFQCGYWKFKQMQSFFRFMFYNLKFVEFQNIQACEDELNFLQLLVKHAASLEKILVEVSKTLSKVKEMELIAFGRKLELLPRTSSRITIQILSRRELDGQKQL
ncbi:hypothetical protein ACHQM5_001618 [Ranunculus cassubicifolius]